MVLQRLILTGCFISLAITCFAQDLEDKTRFSIYPDSFRRYSTSAKDRAEGNLMPQYEDLASNPQTGITPEDWQKNYLSKKRFQKLDTDGDGLIQPEELDQDRFMGKADLTQQTASLIAQTCKKIFPDYRQRMRTLSRRPYVNFDATEYVLNKSIYPIKKLPISLLSSDASHVATKIFIQVKDGRLIKKKVDLGNYALLLMQNQEYNNSFTIYILALIIIVLIAVVTLLVPTLSGK